MENGAPDDLRKIWKQDALPVIVRKGKGFKLSVKLPGSCEDAEKQNAGCAFLHAVKPNGHEPQWLERYQGWQCPQAWFNILVKYLLDHYDKLYIIQPYREQEICASQCMNARGHECNCSCMGENHGAGGPDAGWFEVSDTFATRWGELHLACRLMIKKFRI